MAHPGSDTTFPAGTGGADQEERGGLGRGGESGWLGARCKPEGHAHLAGDVNLISADSVLSTYVHTSHTQ